MSELLVGLSESHLVLWPGSGEDPGRLVHRGMLSDLRGLRDAAAKAGFDLKVCSGFRSFESQLAIWNAKASGKRPILDDAGAPIDVGGLPAKELIHRILRWSALPGASRHHWGTDIDVFDAAAMPEGYRLQLTQEEAHTLFAPFHRWLDHHLHEHGFFRPYEQDLGGVGPEPWHLSYAPLAVPFFEAHSVELLRSVLTGSELARITGSELALRDEVLSDLPGLFERYFLAVCPY